MKGLCNDCEKRSVCKTLCPEAELYVSQDEMDWGETPTTYYDENRKELRVYDPTKNEERALLSTQEGLVLCAFSDGKTRKEIAKNLNISMSNLRMIISNLRKKAQSL